MKHKMPEMSYERGYKGLGPSQSITPPALSGITARNSVGLRELAPRQAAHLRSHHRCHLIPRLRNLQGSCIFHVATYIIFCTKQASVGL